MASPSWSCRSATLVSSVTCRLVSRRHFTTKSFMPYSDGTKHACKRADCAAVMGCVERSRREGQCHAPPGLAARM
eukprot:2232515-Rhodomonas_salina.1